MREGVTCTACRARPGQAVPPTVRVVIRRLQPRGPADRRGQMARARCLWNQGCAAAADTDGADGK